MENRSKGLSKLQEEGHVPRVPVGMFSSLILADFGDTSGLWYVGCRDRRISAGDLVVLLGVSGILVKGCDTESQAREHEVRHTLERR